MKALTFLILGLAATGLAGQQFHGNPLLVSGTYVTKNSQTTYTITLQNITNAPVTDIQIKRAGIWIHSHSYRPVWRLPDIPAKGKKVITVTIRGTVSGLVDPCMIGVEATLRHGKSKTAIALPQPKPYKDD